METIRDSFLQCRLCGIHGLHEIDILGSESHNGQDNADALSEKIFRCVGIRVNFNQISFGQFHWTILFFLFPFSGSKNRQNHYQNLSQLRRENKRFCPFPRNLRFDEHAIETIAVKSNRRVTSGRCRRSARRRHPNSTYTPWRFHIERWQCDYETNTFWCGFERQRNVSTLKLNFTSKRLIHSLSLVQQRIGDNETR